MFRRLHSAQGTPHLNGKTRAWVGEVDLTDGSATVNYSDDLPGMRGSFKESPTILVTGTANGDAYVSSSGTSQATITDDTDTGTQTVNVLVYENHSDLSA